jgi:hypothetical protein
MSALTSGRQFQLWEYHVSHGSLLIRSPAGPGVATSVDIICVGVEYLAAPRHLGEIELSEATAEELRDIERTLQKKLQPSRVWALQSSRGRFLIAAAALKIQEHSGDIFESPFAK